MKFFKNLDSYTVYERFDFLKVPNYVRTLMNGFLIRPIIEGFLNIMDSNGGLLYYP